MWDLLWIAWLLFMVVADVIADRTPGATFSEHCREWFKTWKARALLGSFLLVLYLHFIVSWPVWPVVFFGAGVGYFIGRGYVMMWKKWVEGCVYSGLVAVAALGTGWITGGVTLGELKVLGVAFLGGVLLYIKTHEAPAWDGIERRQDPQTEK